MIGLLLTGGLSFLFEIFTMICGIVTHYKLKSVSNTNRPPVIKPIFDPIKYDDFTNSNIFDPYNITGIRTFQILE